MGRGVFVILYIVVIDCVSELLAELLFRGIIICVNVLLGVNELLGVFEIRDLDGDSEDDLVGVIEP